jgi:hypothetical protein
MTVNGTTIGEGEDVAITATLFNSLSQNDNVSTSSNWPFYGLSIYNENWPPCAYYSPLELVVLKGSYSLSQMREIGTGPLFEDSCMESSSYISFDFQPNNDSAYVTGSYSVTGNVSTYGPVNASVTLTTNGYWDNSSSIAYPPEYGSSEYGFLAAQHPFVPGVYTIAIGDEWGELVVSHLTVV